MVFNINIFIHQQIQLIFVRCYEFYRVIKLVFLNVNFLCSVYVFLTCHVKREGKNYTDA